MRHFSGASYDPLGLPHGHHGCRIERAELGHLLRRLGESFFYSAGIYLQFLECKGFAIFPRTMDRDIQASRPLLEKDYLDSFIASEHIVKSRGQTAIFQQLKSNSSLLLWCMIGSFLTLVASLITLLLAFRLVRSSQQLCVERLSTASPGLEAVKDHWEWRQFDGSVFGQGPFKGPPTEDVLGRWAELATPVAFSIDHQMLKNIGGSEDSVKIPDNLGGGYMAIFEVHHQLHCLSELWKNTWPELYNDDAGNASSTFRQHLDHCADILRQQLLCNGDVSVIPQSWVKHASAPTPNFNVWRKCRSYEAITAWEEEHMVLAPEGRFRKPVDAVELEDFP